eukprot:comp21350_c0_seq1/m.29288 comp21350_c0_seq1/g.29288  ORF comp21350_c0_seq1/g.29288 comp21350_c0_seq1/m.29288 type:complete len:826 (-) comp21350_c0_seq1:414-2891(-)
MSKGYGFLAIPKKDAEPVDYKAGLRQFISENYDDAPGAYDEALNIVNQRKMAANLAEVHQNGLNNLLRYFYQVQRLGEKFPINDQGTIRLEFGWTDAFKGGRKHKCRDSNYELANIMFNYGAILSQLGSNTTLDDNGCKEACTYFQGAAGAFTYIRDSLNGKYPANLCTDLTVDCLTVLANLCLAQAQECFLQKAILGKMKENILARLAAQASDYYAAVDTALDSGSLKGTFSKEWINTVSLKKHYFNAMAAHNQAQSLASQSKFGAAIAYWQIAEAQMKQAQKYAKYTNVDVAPLADKISSTYKSILKDNDTIYHELVPTQVDPVTRAPMVKADPPKLDDGEDLLSGLKPIAIRRAYSRYVEEVKRLVKGECDKLDAQVAASQNALAEVSMPAALDAMQQPQGVPASVLEKSAKCRKDGGVGGLRDKIDNMRTLSQNNLELLQEALRQLDAEETEDDSMRNKHIAEWTRTPSATLTKELREEARMFKSKLDIAIQADATVKKKFEENYNIMDTLCHTDDLAAMLPSGSAQTQPDSVKQLIKTLRDMLTSYDSLRQAVPTLKEMIQTVQARDKQIEAKLIAASSSASDENAVINDHMKATYGPAQKEIDDNVKAQKKLVDEIKVKAQEFHRLASTSDLSRKRETVLRNLGIAYDKFSELSQNLHEGQQFYADLTNRLLKFQGKCIDFCHARKEELEEYKRKIQSAPPARPAQPPARPMGSPAQQQPPAQWQPGMPVQYDSAAFAPQSAYGGYAAANPYGGYPPQQQPQYAQPYGYAQPPPGQYGAPPQPGYPPQAYPQPPYGQAPQGYQQPPPGQQYGQQYPPRK